jgi:hypothetical protein
MGSERDALGSGDVLGWAGKDGTERLGVCIELISASSLSSECVVVVLTWIFGIVLGSVEHLQRPDSIHRIHAIVETDKHVQWSV